MTCCIMVFPFPGFYIISALVVWRVLCPCYRRFRFGPQAGRDMVCPKESILNGTFDFRYFIAKGGSVFTWGYIYIYM